MIGDGQRYICKAPRCSVERRESNHWFLIWGQNGQFCCAPFDERKIREITDRGIRVAWVCGHSCAQKCFEKYLSGINADNVDNPVIFVP